MGVHDMGKFGILVGGFVSALALAIPLVSGGGLGGFSPVVAESGTATTPPTAASGIADGGSSVQGVQGSVTRTAAVPEEPVGGSEDVADAPVAEFGDASPVVGGSGDAWDTADKYTAPNVLTPPYLSTDPDTIARVNALAAQGLSCPALSSFTTSGAPSKTSAQGVAGTTSEDLKVFAQQYNQLRYENCLPGVTRFVYDSCMEQRLFWMAESPSPDPLDAWGHIGSVRIDGVPSVGCDGNLAGGSNNTGKTVATKWWQSLSHRASLYRPGTSTSGVCVALAMTHGGIDEPYTFVRAAARWTTC